MAQSIKIGPVQYRIVEIEGLHENGEKLQGHIHYNSCEIEIEAALSPQSKRQTLWHEIIHGILTHGGFRGHNEQQMEVLGFGIMGVLQDNPWLAEQVIDDQQP